MPECSQLLNLGEMTRCLLYYSLNSSKFFQNNTLGNIKLKNILESYIVLQFYIPFYSITIISIFPIFKILFKCKEGTGKTNPHLYK